LGDGSVADPIDTEDEKPRCRLYLITPASLTCDAEALATFGDTMAAALDAGDVSCIQLRLKDVSDDDWRRATLALMPIAQERDVAFILNDRADLAADLGCDGVHIGQDDMPYAEARARLGRDAIIGVTCKASRDLALDAAEAGADYVAFGAFYESKTKQVTTPASLEIVEWWANATSVPSVAIGGITADNAAPVVQAGADFLAIAGGVWAHPEGAAAGVKAVNAAIDAA
jgi:thiamine-phosphate pyrophosphorylase